MMWQYGWGFGFFSFLWPILWIVLIIVICSRIRMRHSENTQSAEEILSERFAKGQIDETEYKKRLDTLRKYKI